MKLPTARVAAEAGRRRHAQGRHAVAVEPQEEMAGDTIRQCENNCRAMFGNKPAKLAECLSNCR